MFMLFVVGQLFAVLLIRIVRSFTGRETPADVAPEKPIPERGASLAETSGRQQDRGDLPPYRRKIST